jgi:Peptidase family S41
MINTRIGHGLPHKRMQITPKVGAAVMLLLGLVGAPANGQSGAADSLSTSRLAALGRLWGVVKYFHPAFLSRSINWDSAAVVAVPRVIAAETPNEYAAAIDDMLRAIGDPTARVARVNPMPAPASVVARWEADSTLVLSIPTFETDSVTERIRALAGLVRSAHRVVFDLRGPPPRDVDNASGAFSSLDSLLPVPSTISFGVRHRMSAGFPTAAVLSGTASGAYETTRRVRGRPGATTRQVAFVVDKTSDIPTIAWALQRSRRGLIVLQDVCADMPQMSAACAPAVRQDLHRVDMGDGLAAEVTVAELTDPSGLALRADTVVRGVAGDDRALTCALELLRRPPDTLRTVVRNPEFVPAIENAYRDMRYPSLPYRILAAYRWWNAIQYFYPYKSLTGEDWNAVLAQVLPNLRAAGDSLEYWQAVRRMVWHIHDSHGTVDERGSTPVPLYLGVPPRVLLQFIQGQPVVIYAAEDSSTKASGVAVGDVILSIDGKSVAERRSALAPYIASSTPEAVDNVVADELLRGPDGSSAQITVRGAGNREHTISLPRVRGSAPQTYAAYLERSRGSILRLLPGNIGYADLARLTPQMVDSMFEMFGHTKAIIFDDRGYPKQTAWPIAPRLTDRNDVMAARFQRPVVTSPDLSTTMNVEFMQPLPKTSKSRYHGETVMLIDERALSQAEHTGLFFEAANRTRFVGSPTAGADGDVTSVSLPGGISASFSGDAVSHADGRQLQRVGLLPDVAVRPTIEGIRAGRDEVLERAISLVSSGKRP